LEAVYANALTVLLRGARLQVDRQALFEVVFHGVTIVTYRADLIVESKIVVEIKAARAIDRAHCAQLLNYLKASKLEVGLLLNFGQSAQFSRVVSTNKHPRRL